MLEVLIENAAKRKRKYQWGEVINNAGRSFKVYALHEAQLDILRSNAKYTFAFAGTGGGKTCLIPLWIYQRISECYKQGNKQPRILLVSPSVPIFKKSQLQQHLLSTFADTALQGVWLQGEKRYKIESGGEIIVSTVGDGSDYQALTGGQYDGVVGDEVVFLTGEVWEEMRRRGGQKNCPILCVTTPNNNNWIFDVKQEADKGNKDYYVRQWASSNNPTYSADHLQREKLVLSEERYLRMYGGEFSALEGLIFDCFSDPKNPTYPVLTDDPDKRLPSPPVRYYGGNDWGYNPDPSCFLLFVDCEDGITYCVAEIYGTEITPDDYAAKVRELIDKWAMKIDSVYADIGGTYQTTWTDTSRPENMAMFHKAGIAMRKKRVTDIVAGVAITDSYFRAGRLKVFSCCKNLIRELRGYQWQNDRKGELKGKPNERNNHACFVAGTLVTTDQGDIPIESVRPGMFAITRRGYRRITAAAMTDANAVTKTLYMSNGRTITATGNHPFCVTGKGFIPLDAVSNGDTFITMENQWSKQLFTNGLNIEDIRLPLIEQTDYITNALATSICIGGYGKTQTAGRYLKDIISTIKTAIRLTMILPILNYCKDQGTYPCTVAATTIGLNPGVQSRLQWKPQRYGTDQKQVGNGIANTQRQCYLANPNYLISLAKYVARRLKRIGNIIQSSALMLVGRRQGECGEMITLTNSVRFAARHSQPANSNRLQVVPVNAVRLSENVNRQAVFNITVDEQHEYFANGVLVSNCDALRYAMSSQKYHLPAIPLPPESPTNDEAKLERIGVTADQLKEKAAADEKIAYQEWFNKMLQLEAGR